MASSDKHYHPVVAARLRTLLSARDWQDVVDYLTTLSNAQFRTAGYMLGESLTSGLSDDDFWTLSKVLISFNDKAFLVTMLKGAVNRGLDIANPKFQELCNSLKSNEMNVRKTLLNLLPCMKNPDEVERLFTLLGVMDAERRIPYLLRTLTTSASYVLLRTLKYLEHDRALLIRTTYFLMKRGDGLSFNLASLLKVYFGLDEIHGTFSLRIEPYQLARLDNSYEAFCQALKL